MRRKEFVGSFQVPEEIEREILSRLPVKSLFRFKTVKKSWRNLIGDSTFIAMHLNCYGSNTDGFLVHGCYSYGIQLSRSSFDQPRKYIIGSINGLVCLSDKIRCFLKKDDRLRIHICSPSTREIMELPQCYHDHNDFLSGIGFGFCRKFNDYKVVKVSYRRDSSSSEAQVQVYSSNMNSWKMIKIENPSLWTLLPLYRGSGCFNGAFHWQGLKKSSSKKIIKTVVSFQFDEEVFREINLPNDPDFQGDVQFFITEYRDFFSSLVVKQGPNVNVYKVWVMKEYGAPDSWIKQLTIEVPISQDQVMFRSIRDIKYKDILFQDSHHRFIWYDTKSKQMDGQSQLLLQWYCTRCKESLVSLSQKR
ncbi:hypothetical protein V6Z11_D06G209600 [Gossypium hirsutum]|uniref:F-box protein CPR1 n=1 Tax=Gossypium hirsutum TaxID=3635 RepID=A0A1U8J0I2_GOSHI|nr:F-box protein CPR1-like [Gossypium hirsutum]